MYVTDKSPEQMRWYLRPFFWRQRRRYGAPLVPVLVWARVPALYFALAGFYAARDRRRSLVEPALRSLVQTRVSQVNHCDFCIDLNAAIAAERGGSMEKALAVGEWRGSDLFSARERFALDYAEVITQTEQRVSEDLIGGCANSLMKTQSSNSPL